MTPTERIITEVIGKKILWLDPGLGTETVDSFDLVFEHGESYCCCPSLYHTEEWKPYTLDRLDGYCSKLIGATITWAGEVSSVRENLDGTTYKLHVYTFQVDNGATMNVTFGRTI